MTDYSVSRGGIVRGWSKEARDRNFRNFRFWLVFLLGSAAGFFGLMFVLGPFIRDITSGADITLGPAFGLLFCWLSYSILSLRRSRAYDWGAGLGCLVIGSGILILIVILVPMYDPNNEAYGKPSDLPLGLPIGMVIGGIAFLWLCLWMDDPLTPKAVSAEKAHANETDRGKND